MLAHECGTRSRRSATPSTVLRMSTGRREHELRQGRHRAPERQLARLIDDLLDVSRITSGKIRLKRELVEPARSSGRPSSRSGRSSRNGSTADHRFREGDVAAPGGPDTRRAGRGEPAHQRRKVHRERRTDPARRARGGHVVITVKTTGSASRPRSCPQMFELFSQGERSIARSEGGLGIGLTIVQNWPRCTAGASRHERGAREREPVHRSPARGETVSVYSGPIRLRSRRGGGSRILVVDDNVDTASGMATVPQAPRQRGPGRPTTGSRPSSVGRRLPARVRPARHRAARHERLRGGSRLRDEACCKDVRDHRRLGIRPRRRPPPLPRGGIRPPSGQAGRLRSARPAHVAGFLRIVPWAGSFGRDDWRSRSPSLPEVTPSLLLDPGFAPHHMPASQSPAPLARESRWTHPVGVWPAFARPRVVGSPVSHSGYNQVPTSGRPAAWQRPGPKPREVETGPHRSRA